MVDRELKIPKLLKKVTFELHTVGGCTINDTHSARNNYEIYNKIVSCAEINCSAKHSLCIYSKNAYNDSFYRDKVIDNLVKNNMITKEKALKLILDNNKED